MTHRWARSISIIYPLPSRVIDLPMVKDRDSRNNPTVETIKALVAELTGHSPFTGTHNKNVWCGSWDTRR